MAGKLKLIIALVCVLVAGTLAFSCAPSATTKDFTGEWELLFGSDEGLDKDTIDMSKSQSSNVILTLEDDGAGNLDIFGDVTNLTWETTNETEGIVTVEGNNAASMKIEDDQLILSNGDESTLTFGRVSSE